MRVIAAILITLCMASCSSNDTLVPPSQYAAKIIGSWQGMIGDDRETMTLKRDSTFVCEFRPRGFIANTLSQTLPGTIRGTWNITDSVIIMNINSEKNENTQNGISSSTIITFKQDSLVLKSDYGGTSAFRRVLNL